MRAFCLFLVCLALTARPAMSAEDDAAISKADESSSNKKDATDAVELLETAETNNNNNTAVAEEGETKTNSKRTIDHNLGYGYRFNSVLRPVPHMHHYMPSMPGLPYMRRPMFKQQRYPHHHFPSGFSSGPASSPSASGPAAGAAPFRFSQPLPSPPHRDEEQPQHQIREQLREQLHDQLREQLREQPATRPVTEAPSGPHTENVYRTLPFSYEDEPQKTVTMTAGMEASSSKAESEQQATPESPVQYADEAATGPTSSAAHSYQQVLQHLQQASEPTYILASTATAPHSLMYSAASHASQLTTPLTAVFGHGMGGGQGGHPVMYAPHVASGAATQMIPVIIVRLMDSQPAAATLGAAQVPSHHLSAVPYPLVNMQLLREHLSKMYSSQHSVTPQFMAAEPEPVVYSSPLFSSAQLQKLQLQHQLHSQLQKQLQVQQLQQQQRQSVAALLQEQHRQRLASLSGQQHSQQHSQQRGSLSGLRTEVTVHRSPALSPQDYKESVEQQEEA